MLVWLQLSFLYYCKGEARLEWKMRMRMRMARARERERELELIVTPLSLSLSFSSFSPLAGNRRYQRTKFTFAITKSWFPGFLSHFLLWFTSLTHSHASRWPSSGKIFLHSASLHLIILFSFFSSSHLESRESITRLTVFAVPVTSGPFNQQLLLTRIFLKEKKSFQLLNLLFILVWPGQIKTVRVEMSRNFLLYYGLFYTCLFTWQEMTFNLTV